MYVCIYNQLFQIMKITTTNLLLKVSRFLDHNIPLYNIPL